MKTERFEELEQSVKEAAAIESGHAKPSRTFEINTDKKRIGRRTKFNALKKKDGSSATLP